MPQSAREGATVFETPRLRARRLDIGDLDALVAVYGDAEVVRWAGDRQPLSRERCAQWVQVTLEKYRRRGYGMFALERKASGEVVGFCGLVHPGGQVEPEIKYALLRQAWGQGLATEAARGLLGDARARGIGHVIATVAPANVASQRVLAKAGMTPGALRDNDDGSQTQLFHWHAVADDNRG